MKTTPNGTPILTGERVKSAILRVPNVRRVSYKNVRYVLRDSKEDADTLIRQASRRL